MLKALSNCYLLSSGYQVFRISRRVYTYAQIIFICHLAGYKWLKSRRIYIFVSCSYAISDLAILIIFVNTLLITKGSEEQKVYLILSLSASSESQGRLVGATRSKPLSVSFRSHRFSCSVYFVSPDQPSLGFRG